MTGSSLAPARDVTLRRVERTAMGACLLMTVAALVIGRGDWRIAAGVLGGGLLIAISYYAIASAVTALGGTTVGGDGQRRPSNLAWTLAKLTLRYALLAILAYVMIARLRLHPVAVVAGASSVVAAASVEAFRVLLKK